MKTLTFKTLPVVRYYEKDEDENNKKAHYTVTLERAIMGDIIKNKNWDDGSDDCEGYEDNEFTIAEMDEEMIKAAMLNITPDWNNIKTIFFDETCTVPRYKTGKFCTDKNLKVTRDKTKADLIIYGPSYSDDLWETEECHLVTKAYFLKKVNQLKVGKAMFDTIVPIIQACESEYVEIVGCERLMPKSGQIQGDVIKLTEDSNYDVLCSNTNLCHQDIILENMASVVMDEDMFRRVCQMFDSADEENYPVAMEVMANCNYGESIVYLLELMRRYYPKIHDIPSRKHVSFTALKEYLDFAPKSDERTLDQIIHIVATKRKLTEDNYNRILNFIIEEENKRMSSGEDRYENTNWRILAVDIAPKYKDQVIWNKKPTLVSEKLVFVNESDTHQSIESL